MFLDTLSLFSANRKILKTNATFMDIRLWIGLTKPGCKNSRQSLDAA